MATNENKILPWSTLLPAPCPEASEPQVRNSAYLRGLADKPASYRRRRRPPGYVASGYVASGYVASGYVASGYVATSHGG